MIDVNIDKDALFKELGYEPHARQRLFHDSKAKYRIPCCGRRFGKSMMCGRDMTKRMFIPDSMHWIIGPTYPLGEKEFRVVFNDIFRKLKLGSLKGIKKSYDVKQGNMRIEMPWNAILEVKSAEKADSLVGEGLDSAIMSEAAIHRPDTWEMYVEPALLDKDGSCDFPSTPRGHNWYEGQWLMGQNPNEPEYESWRFPTWDNSALFPLGEDDPRLQAKKRKVSEFHWLQEYCAEFTAIEGRIYSEFKRETHVTDIRYNPFWRNYQFFDFGYSDPFVCLDVMRDPSDNMYIWREYHVQHKTNQEHGVILQSRENPEHFRVDARFSDPRDPDARRTLNSIISGVPIIARQIPTDTARGVGEWLQGIEIVKQWMKIQDDGRPKLFVNRSCTNTIRSLERLQAIPERDGRNAREGQKDWDDHEADALRYGMGELFILGYQRGDLSAVYSAVSSETESPFSYHSQFLHDMTALPHGLGT
jgi:hypothetical protein